MKQLNVRIPEDMHQRLERYAKETGIARQYLVSQALEALLAKAEKQQQRKGAK